MKNKLNSNFYSTWCSCHGTCVCFREMVKGDHYLYVMFCSGPTSRSLQGALERMSEENNVCGLLSFGSGEVLIYGISVVWGLAEQKQDEWVDSALVPPGENQRKRREKKTAGRVEHSPKYNLMFNSCYEILKFCLLALMHRVVEVAWFDLYTLLMHWINFLFSVNCQS